jgi:hypothetical protein
MATLAAGVKANQKSRSSLQAKPTTTAMAATYRILVSMLSKRLKLR